jgi:hypothetical protein
VQRKVIIEQVAPWLFWTAFFLTLMFISLCSGVARADEPISIHGFLDSYFVWNANRPANHQNFVPGAGTTAAKANEFEINLAEVEFARDPKPVGFKFSIVAGNGTDVVHASDPARDTFRYIYQASLSYRTSGGVLVEAGVFPSHIGYEGFYSKDNWNYTRGWLGELSPYYQAGVKATYAWNDRWSGQLHVLNGWQVIGENNDGKAVGTQIAYTAPRFGVTFNTFVGPELPNDNKHLRVFGDWIATYQATKQLSFAGSVDRACRMMRRRIG